jgi:hypothetical protein
MGTFAPEDLCVPVTPWFSPPSPLHPVSYGVSGLA